MLPYRFRGSEFHILHQPNHCPTRVWLTANCPQLAADDSAFQDLLLRRGKAIEERHLEQLGPYQEPIYPPTDFAAGAESTLELIRRGIPIIYQPVLISTDGLLGIPDFLILDSATECYKVRDVKLAVNVKHHPEILLQMGLYQIAANHALGYTPDIELVTGDGQVQPFQPADEQHVYQEINEIIDLRRLPEAPVEPVGWSKCEPCVFRNTCWDPAIESRDVATVPYVDQGASRRLLNLGITNYDHLFEMSEELLADLKRLRGKREQRIGATTARKIKMQVQALKNNRVIVDSPPPLPPGCRPGTRPVVMFDIENDVFDPDLGVKVYLWGCLLAKSTGSPTPELIVAGPGVEGDEQGWIDFLDYVGRVFGQFGDIPFVHYSSHERTWIRKYIERYGDPNNTAKRLIDNLWDMYDAISKHLFLPTSSYGLKSIEQLVGFKRSQEEFGGLWSIITYDQYINAPTQKEANLILQKILTYNTEDIMASLAIYEWLEKLIAERA